MTTGVLGAGQVFPAGSPFETHTMMFPMVLPLPRASISLGTGPECFLAHAGSASMASGLSVGAFPSNVTVPVMDDAATATPGHIDNATSPATRRHLFPLQRMLGSLIILVIANLVSVDAVFRPSSRGPNVHRARCRCNPDPQTLSKPSSSILSIRTPAVCGEPTLHCIH